MYVVYHGPVGLQRIANKVHVIAQIFKSSVENLGYKLSNSTFFDTITLDVSVAGSAQVVSQKVRGSTFVVLMISMSVSHSTKALLKQIWRLL